MSESTLIHDSFLTGEKLLSIAENENKANIQKTCDMLFGIVDIISCILFFLPLYPNPIDGYIYSVNGKAGKPVTYCSMGLSIIMVLFLAMAREAYAITVAFLLLLMKGIILLKYIKTEK